VAGVRIGAIGIAALTFIASHPRCTQGQAAREAASITQGSLANGLKAVARLRTARYVHAVPVDDGARLALTITARGEGVLAAVSAIV
jgi:hypothetical protein